MDGVVVTLVSIELLSYYSTKWNLSEGLRSKLTDSNTEGTLKESVYVGSEDLNNSI